MDEGKSGTLYIVATPIGNSRDMSPRGKQILEEADLIAAEDTRRSMVLLNKLGIRGKLVSNHKYNEHGKARYFIAALREGQSVAVITDAGTPCVSDPGNELIKAAVEDGIVIQNMAALFPVDKAESLSARNIKLIEEVAERTSSIERQVEELVNARKLANKIEDEHEKAIAYHDKVEPKLDDIRYQID